MSAFCQVWKFYRLNVHTQSRGRTGGRNCVKFITSNVFKHAREVPIDVLEDSMSGFSLQYLAFYFFARILLTLGTSLVTSVI